jgi:glycosyltransferase involved in cell wall biosynthesis
MDNIYPKILVSHPTGNANVRAVLSAFMRADVLSEFHTTITAADDSIILKLLPKSVRKEFLRRKFEVHPHRLKTYPVREMGRLAFGKLGFEYLTRHEQGIFSLQKVYANFDKAVAKSMVNLKPEVKLSAVYCYEDGALATFKEAKKRGLVCIYDLPIAYFEKVRSLLKFEAERLPEWAPTLGGGLSDSQEKLDRKAAEIELADIVIGPGKFVLESIPEWAKTKKQIMSPFGSPQSFEASNFRRADVETRPLRVLFVGSMGQRKGLGDLFNAIHLLNRSDVELVVLGSPILPIEFYKEQLSNFVFEKSRPHADVLKLMQSCDVFCLPSIAEGRALVIQEAMSQGLPIIITPNTGGEDLVIEGNTGFLVPIRSPEKIAEKINWFAENRDQIPEMGMKARELAETLSWQKYGDRIVSGIKELI